MPFTISHPAIVLPLTFLPRQWFSLTGLVIGSLTPDFEYFLRMRIKSNYSHTLDGLFWFDLPLGLLLAFLFHNVVRDSLFDNLPISLKSIFFAFRQIPILKILQHSSTIIGGLVIAFAIYKLPTNKAEKENVNLKYWTIFAGLT